MKRRGTKSQDQPVVKKPDVTVATDLRSKIGAKLQTLLNGITADSDLFIKSKRQLYADLFREPQYSEIIIDPTIVVKIENPDSEESSDNVSQDNPENILSSAKSKITELLNKRQDSEKENSVNAKECIPSSSQKCKTLPTSSRSSRRRVKSSSTSESSNASHSDVLINQGQLQNVPVVSRNVIKPKSRTKHTHLLRKKSSKSQSNSSSQKASPNKKALVKHKKSAVKVNHCVTTGKIVTNSDLSNNLVSDIVKRRRGASNSKLPTNSTITTKRQRSCRKNCSNLNSSNSSKSSSCDASATVANSSDFITTENENLDMRDAFSDSEAVDDAEICLSVKKSMGLLLNNADCETITDGTRHEPDVVLLCEKRPTYDVITIDEDENSGNLAEDVHKCNQCGKTFRAKSLLNFHLRMHGTDSSSAVILPSSILVDSITSRRS